MPRPCGVGLQQIVDVEHRLAEERVAALLLDLEQRALDRADRRGGDVAVLGRELSRVVADELQHRAQVLQVEQQQAVVVGDLEDERQHALLRRVQVEQPAEQQRARDRRSSRAPESRACRTRPRRRPGWRAHAGSAMPVDFSRSRSFGDIAPAAARPDEIAFDVGEKHRHAEAREIVGEHLQRDGLAGAGRAGDQAVTVGQRRTEQHVLAGGAVWR